MFPIWSLSNKTVNSVLFYQCDDTHYIVTRDGEWTPIVSCGLYVIVNQELLSFFQTNLSEPVEAATVSIYDRALDQYFPGYSRLDIQNDITPQNIKTLDHKGFKIWCHRPGGGIFISAELKERLDQADIPGLETHAGFSWYA